MPKILLGAVFVASIIFAHAGWVQICTAQTGKGQPSTSEAPHVLIQKEKGPGGHSTIGIVEDSTAGTPGKTLTLTFSKLMTWRYDVANNTPPEKIASMDGRRVKLTGFMYPLQQGESIRYFCLLRTTQTCCYGPRPQFNQYVFVEMNAPTVFYRLDPVSCRGVFRVDPMPDEGYIYRLEGETCAVATGKDQQ